MQLDAFIVSKICNMSSKMDAFAFDRPPKDSAMDNGNGDGNSSGKGNGNMLGHPQTIQLAMDW